MKKIYYLIKRYLMIFGIFVDKPLLFLRCIKYFIVNSMFRCPQVKKLEIGITYDCQLNCERCSSHKMRDMSREKLSVHEFRKLGVDCLESGVLQVNFTGGEPLIREDILDIISCFEPNKTFISVNTNGILLNEKKIREFIEIGVDMLKISIDSPNANEHDQMRGKQGCFDNLLKVIRITKRLGGIRVQLSTVPTHDDLVSGKVLELVGLAEKYDVTLGLVLPAKAGKWADKNNLLTNEDKNNLERIANHPLVIKDTHVGRFRSGCSAGKEEVYMTCYGDITPCPHIQMSFGNVREDSFKNICKVMRENPAFAKDNFYCLASEDEEFMGKYLDPIKDSEVMPVNINKHPAFKKEDDV